MPNSGNRSKLEEAVTREARAHTIRLRFKVVRCQGGFNVHGLGPHSGHLYFECLHLHPTAAEAHKCADVQREAQT